MPGTRETVTATTYVFLQRAGRTALSVLATPTARYCLIVVAGLFCLWLIWAGGNDRAAEATHKYWMDLQEISFRAGTIGEPAGQELDDMIAHLEKAQTAIEQFTSEINQLDITDVDQEVVDHAARLVAFGIRSQQASDEIVLQLKRNKAFITYANSWLTLGESLVRGIFFDFSLSAEARAQAQKLDAETVEAFRKLDALHEELANLQAEEITLRRKLSERYGKPFPPLDPPVDA